MYEIAYLNLSYKNGNVGIGRTPTTNKLEVEGTASKTTAGEWIANSDFMIKTDVMDIKDALAKIENLRPVRFKYASDYRLKHPSIKDRYYYNFIAQEFGKVFPDAVSNSGEGYLQLDTYLVTPYLVASVKELAEKNEELSKENLEVKRKLSQLEEKVASLEK